MSRRSITIIILITSASGGVSAAGIGEAGNPGDRSALMIGLLALAGAVLVGLGMGILTLFMTRREAESRHAELDRRISTIEGNARQDTGELHEKVNRAHASISAIEAETHSQSKQLDVLGRQLTEILRRLPQP